MEIPKVGDTIIVKTPTGQFTEGIADVEKPNIRPVKGEVHITVYTKNRYDRTTQYSIGFKDGTESLAVMMNSVHQPQVKEGMFRVLFATTIPNTV